MRMKTIILCGGMGTRLRELTQSIPKPLVEIGGKPILWHIMKIYSHYGFNDFILCLGYKGELIREYFKDNKEIQWNIIFEDTGINTNTGGRIKKIEHRIHEEMFFATYGDGLASINLNELIDFHKSKNTTATITCVNPLSQFGIVEIDEQEKITRFKEKPPLSQWINGGFFVFNKDIFKYLTENDVLEKAPFEKLAVEKEISAYKFKGFWSCMDTYKDTQTLNELWQKGSPPWMIWKD